MERRTTTDRPSADRTVATLTATINDLMDELVAGLEGEGIPDPLGQSLTLGFVWADLCRLAGEEVPAAVAALLDETVAA